MDERIHELTAAYALDALDADERASYEAHLGTCQPCQEELSSFWNVTGALAYAASGPAPSPGLRDRILEEARAERPNVVPFRPRNWATPALAAVAAVAAVVAIGMGLWGLSLSDELDETREVARVLEDPGARTVPLQGAEGRLDVSDTGEAVLVVAGLDEPRPGKAYEVWVIQDGRPEPAGLFDDESVVPLERSVPPGVVVAVTLEDDEGVDQPTGQPLFSASV
jgi:anti-sigma-K factor RskA